MPSEEQGRQPLAPPRSSTALLALRDEHLPASLLSSWRQAPSGAEREQQQQPPTHPPRLSSGCPSPPPGLFSQGLRDVVPET